MAGYTYNPNSQIETSSFKNDMPVTTYFYNVRNWVYLLSSFTNHSVFFTESMLYNPNGNINSQSIDGSYKENFSSPDALYYHYTYDKSNRLVKSDADMPADLYDLLMSYDADGNFQSMTRTGSDKAHSDLFVYDYASGTNKLMQIRGAAEYDYDLNGNLIRDDINHTWNMSYDFRNLLISFKSIRHVSDKPEDPDHVIYTEYAYDEAGNRISKKVWKYTGEDPDPVIELESPGTWVLLTNDFYLRNTSGAEVAVYNSTAIQFWNIWGIDNVGRINADTTKQFYLKDHLGSIRCVLNSASTIISSQDFDAWGHEMEGRKYDAGTSSSKYLFTSKERDSESNYDYFGARYYDTRVARWGGMEPKYNKFISFSPYIYSIDNPIILKDINGKDIDFGSINKTDPEYTQNIIKQLEVITGLKLGLDDNVKLQILGNNNSEKLSKGARDFISGLISNHDVNVQVFGNNNKPSQAVRKLNQVNMNKIENNSFKMSPDLNPLTMGAGMILLHELLHTAAGGGFSDPISQTGIGEVENILNGYRSELGDDWGYRFTYFNFLFNGEYYIPFSAYSNEQMFKDHKAPTTSFMKTYLDLKKNE